ncbi:MAG: hypothetical protein JXQ73_26430 [Phycisphaerae bacterium]|nr:hypothetical protein [Phycisphaerae bacterium]
MSCPTESDLLRMASGELTGPSRQSVLAHVELCSTCAGRVQELQDLWDLMGAWDVDASTHDVEAGVTAGVGVDQARESHHLWRWPVPLRAAASVALAVGIGWGAGRYPWTSPSTSRDEAQPLRQVATTDQVVQDLNLDALNCGVPTGLAITLLDEELLPEPEEENG